MLNKKDIIEELHQYFNNYGENIISMNIFIKLIQLKENTVDSNIIIKKIKSVKREFKLSIIIDIKDSNTKECIHSSRLRGQLQDINVITKWKITCLLDRIDFRIYNEWWSINNKGVSIQLPKKLLNDLISIPGITKTNLIKTKNGIILQKGVN